MKSFLNIVAQDILAKYGTNLSEVVVVFPNKRASLFLNEELIKLSDGKPVWSPKYMTISELFRSQSQLVVADQIKLVCELYKHYAEKTGTTESLDDFYGWGELMLSDFDDLDKNMGNAEHIFENTDEIHSYDSADYLSKDQKEALKRFFSNFSDDDSKVKQNFAQLWNNLGNIYTSFRDSLRAQGIAYEGMLYRDVAEELKTATTNTKHLTPNTHYLFVGFNLIQPVEQELMAYLKREGKAAFYWDYDNYYMADGNEAGRYIKSYLSAFPNEITLPEAFNNFTNKPGITYISASTEDVQARYVSQWLTEERIKAGKRTAIVLCDEKLLPTVLHALPDTVKDINITSGYPLQQTLIATLVKQIFILKQRGSSRIKGALRLHQVNTVLHHPYMKFISEKAEELTIVLNDEKKKVFYPTIEELSLDEHLANIFTPISHHDEAATPLEAQRLRCLDIITCISKAIHRIATNCAEPDPLMQESLYRMYQIMNRVSTLIVSDELIVSDSSLQSILNQIIRSTSVPFHGEPIIGIQVMGVLETRNLDFDHMLILSANEGNIPKSVNDSSFIPHVIRRAYGLTTIENKIAIYAYYFHRMMQRATDVSITYNNSTNDTKTNEMSRFMMQLIAESDLKINIAEMTSSLLVGKKERCDVQKNKEVIEKMEQESSISPTAINTYLRCQLQYFYRFVCGISDNTESDEEEMDNRVFGLVFHKAAEILYAPFKGKSVTESMIDGMLKDPSIIERAIDEGFKEELFSLKDEEAKKRPMPTLDGTQLIHREIIRKMLRQLLEYDKKNCPITIVDVEKYIEDYITFDTDRGPRTLKIKGIIDRLDIVKNGDGHLEMRVVDYKTGSRTPGNVKSVSDIFTPEGANSNAHTDYYLQTLLYSRILAHPMQGTPQNGTYPVVPALLYPHRSQAENYDPVLKIDKERIADINAFTAEYNDGFIRVLKDIYDYSRPFAATQNADQCERCFYKNICGKNK